MEWIEEADGVFRSGGVKGLGLAGALLGFAEHPEKPVKKWVNVAGASAGAIIACYLAVGHDADDIAALMTKTNFGRFQDFLWPGEILGGGLNLLRKQGLARGDAFRDWFSEQLEGKTFASTKSDDGTRNRLKLIAVDATNRALLVLPDDLPRYRLNGQPDPIDPDEFELADAARMSMSIPYFFEPVELIRDRVIVTDKGGTGRSARRPACRPDRGRARERGRTKLRRRRSDLPRDERRGDRAAAIGDHRRRDALELPCLAVRRRHDRAASTDVRVHAHRRPRRRRGLQRVRRSTCPGRSGSASTSSTPHKKHGTPASSLTRRGPELSRLMRATSATTQFNLTADDQAMLLANGRAAAKRFLDRFDLAGYENTFHAHLSETTPEKTARAVSTLNR